MLQYAILNNINANGNTILNFLFLDKKTKCLKFFTLGT